jgi:hypothetical protein
MLEEVLPNKQAVLDDIEAISGFLLKNNHQE